MCLNMYHVKCLNALCSLVWLVQKPKLIYLKETIACALAGATINAPKARIICCWHRMAVRWMAMVHSDVVGLDHEEHVHKLQVSVSVCNL